MWFLWQYLCCRRSRPRGCVPFGRPFWRINAGDKNEKSPKMLYFQGFSMALHYNFDTIAVRVHFGASGCIRVRFVLVFIFCS